MHVASGSRAGAVRHVEELVESMSIGVPVRESSGGSSLHLLTLVRRSYVLADGAGPRPPARSRAFSFGRTIEHDGARRPAGAAWGDPRLG